MAYQPLGNPHKPEKLSGWLIAAFLVLRALVLGAPVAIAFVLVSSLVSGVVEGERWRWLFGGIVCLGAPLFMQWRIDAFLEKRGKRGTPSMGAFLAIANSLIAAAIAFGFADDAGRSLRRHGDWFVGERNGAVARGYRAGVTVLAEYLERFDPPPELAPVVIPPDERKIPAGPWRPGEVPPESLPTTLAWFHPLAGPRRAMPGTESRRFGAQRPPPRPMECELGHCGVDLGNTLGEPVFAAFDGVVERIERDETSGGRAGRYLRLGHKDGTVVTRYIHLDSIRADLKEGDHVKGGELVARMGRTGVINSGPHLHFGLSMRQEGHERYVDPEPFLRSWQLPDPTSALNRTAFVKESRATAIALR
jgi:hypothetical protein